jgi:hypothetical protein
MLDRQSPGPHSCNHYCHIHSLPYEDAHQTVKVPALRLLENCPVDLELCPELRAPRTNVAGVLSWLRFFSPSAKAWKSHEVGKPYMHPVSKQLVCASEPLLIQTRICFRGSHPCAQMTTQVGRIRVHVFAPLVYNEIAKGSQGVLARNFSLFPSQKHYGVSSLIRVDQLPSAERTPTPPGEPAHVPSRLSPLPPAKNGPPQVV